MQTAIRYGADLFAVFGVWTAIDAIETERMTHATDRR
jgi:hypothetical protein